MHNLKDIRKDFTVFAKSLEKRSINLDVKNLQKLDEENRQLIQKKETLEKEKKDISKSKLIDTNKHLILTSGHPSPLSANRGYWFGNRHFSKTNDYLKKNGLNQISW